MRRRPPAPRVAEPGVTALFAIPVEDVALHARISPAPTLAAHLTALAVGAGILLLSPLWATVAQPMVALGWIAAMAREGTFSPAWRDASWGSASESCSARSPAPSTGATWIGSGS